MAQFNGEIGKVAAENLGCTMLLIMLEREQAGVDGPISVTEMQESLSRVGVDIDWDDVRLEFMQLNGRLSVVGSNADTHWELTPHGRAHAGRHSW